MAYILLHMMQSGSYASRKARFGKFMQMGKFARQTSMLMSRGRGPRIEFRARRSRPSNSAGSYSRGRYVAGKSGPEIKNWDQTTAQNDCVASIPIIYCPIAGIAEGTAANQRVGQKIQLKSMEIVANIFVTETTVVANVPQPVFLDLYVVHDKSPDGALAAAADVLAVTTTNLTFANTTNLDRFVILRHKRFVLTATPNANIADQWVEHVPLDLAVRYIDGTDDPQTNSILILGVCPGTAALNTGASFTVATRAKYLDE